MNNITGHINYNAYLYQQSVMDKFEEICQPLLRLGIKSFQYFKLFEDGKYLALTNNLEYLKAYFLNIRNNGAFFTKKVSTIQEEDNFYSFLTDIKKFDKKKDPILHILYDFNIWNSFVIYKKNNKVVECYNFQMTREDTEFSQFYLNNLNLLERFCDYFNDRARDIIDCSDQQKLACFDQQFDFSTTSKDDLKAKKIQQFLQETQIKKRALPTESYPFFSLEEIEGIQYLALGKSVKEISSDIELPSYLVERSFQSLKCQNKREEPTKSHLALQSLQQFLSPRQKECLFLLTRGKTAKQTARLLGIDYRTVQTHIDLLKSKLNCHSKEQLIEKAFESGFAYLVPQSLNKMPLSRVEG